VRARSRVRLFPYLAAGSVSRQGGRLALQGPQERRPVEAGVGEAGGRPVPEEPVQAGEDPVQRGAGEGGRRQERRRGLAKYVARQDLVQRRLASRPPYLVVDGVGVGQHRHRREGRPPRPPGGRRQREDVLQRLHRDLGLPAEVEDVSVQHDDLKPVPRLSRSASPE
jgi:hypothetical protein